MECMGSIMTYLAKELEKVSKSKYTKKQLFKRQKDVESIKSQLRLLGHFIQIEIEEIDKKEKQI